jgi:anti-sigma regulatory factor (Ser/Thr protein kinase)
VQADAKEMKIAVELPPYDLFVNCDVQKMERVMINIIGNAVKFTPAKGGCITVRLERHLELENMALLSVSDNGVGIPAEALQRVTQRYFRVGGHVVGSGLGLAISREIVDLHGGTLSMASPVPGSDKGTMVAVSLPLCDPPIVAIFGETMDMAYEARRQVGNYGYRTLMTYSIEEALTLCAAHKADMLLFECDTGINNDFSPLLRLRNDSRTQQMPVLVLSRSEISRPCRDMLQHLGVPLLPVPWLERDLVERLNGAFSGRSLVSPV